MRPSCVLDSLHVFSLQLSSSPLFSSLSVFIQSSFGCMHPPNLPRRGKSMSRAIFSLFLPRLEPPPDGRKFHPKTCVSLETSLKNGISEASLFRSIFVTIFRKTCVSRGTSLKKSTVLKSPLSSKRHQKKHDFCTFTRAPARFCIFSFFKKKLNF